MKYSVSALILTAGLAVPDLLAGQRIAPYFEQQEGAFLARADRLTLRITPASMITMLDDERLVMRFAGANPHASMRGEQPLPGRSNYFTRNDPRSWRTNVPHFAKARINDVYSGIDAVYYENGGRIEYDLVVKPGADPRQVRLRFDGARRVDLDRNGDLVLHTERSELRQRAPVVYQGTSRVGAKYRRVSSREVTIDVASYDRRRPLVIDPVLVYSTFLGGSGEEQLQAVAADAAGNAYVTGWTYSTDFPAVNAVQPAAAGRADLFVAKFSPNGTLLYSTYVGGSGDDLPNAIAADSSGNAYVTGLTTSSDFPTVNALQTVGGAFLVKLNATGSALSYSTHIGGSVTEEAFGITVDASGAASISGVTFSPDFPTTPGAFQTGLTIGSSAGFVTKVNAAGSAFVYSTLFGKGNIPFAIAVDASGNAFIGGAAISGGIPLVNAMQPAFAGARDGYVAKLNSTGSAVIYSTYLGGSAIDEVHGIAIDAAGNAYVTGLTESTDFPTANAFQPLSGGNTDAFVAKLNSSGTALVYSTYLGGSAIDEALAIAVDSASNAYVGGVTQSTNFPTVSTITPCVAYSATAVKLNAAGSALLYSTCIDSGDFDNVGLAIDSSGNAYLGGSSSSGSFPMVNAAQPQRHGGTDAFLAKLALNTNLAITNVHNGAFVQGQAGATYTISVSNTGRERRPDP